MYWWNFKIQEISVKQQYNEKKGKFCKKKYRHLPVKNTFNSELSRFRVPSRLSLLSCHVRQLVVWAINADRAAGVHGSRAGYSPPVAIFPSPLYVPVFYS